MNSDSSMTPRRVGPRVLRRRVSWWGAGVGVLSLAIVCGSVAAGAGSATGGARVAPNLVLNGGFEQGLTGWRVNDPDAETLRAVKPGRDSAASVSVVSRQGGSVVLNDAKNTVLSTKVGATYSVSAWVRADQRWQTGQVRIREVARSRVVDQKGAGFALSDTDWHRVSFAYTAVSDGAVLDLNVVGWNLAKGGALHVDDVAMSLTTPASTSPAAAGAAPVAVPRTPAPSARSAAPSPGTPSSPVRSAAPSAPASPAASAPKPSTPAVRAPVASAGASALKGACKGSVSTRGIPSCGAYVGAAVGGNTDPSAREKQIGDTLAIRRTYYRGDQVPSAIAAARSDLAAGRLPWISFKMPMSWEKMAAGEGDAWARDLTARLKTLDGPVWVAFHHEPEHDGDMAAWKAMQRRLSPILRSADNVGFTIILTGWNQFFSGDPQFSMNALWPGDGLVDVVAVDIYNWKGAKDGDGKVITESETMQQYYDKLAPWAAQHKVAWGVAESGYTNEAAATDPQWLDRAVSGLVASGGSAFAYFDSPLNSTGSWELQTSTKIQAFGRAMDDTVRLP